ncbi:hypothetical protein Tco_0609432 [Tanacetum coccineum]
MVLRVSLLLTSITCHDRLRIGTRSYCLNLTITYNVTRPSTSVTYYHAIAEVMLHTTITEGFVSSMPTLLNWGGGHCPSISLSSIVILVMTGVISVVVSVVVVATLVVVAFPLPFIVLGNSFSLVLNFLFH